MFVLCFMRNNETDTGYCYCCRKLLCVGSERVAQILSEVRVLDTEHGHQEYVTSDHAGVEKFLPLERLTGSEKRP